MKRPIICITAVGLALCMSGSVQGIETVGLTSSVLSASAAEISDSGTCGQNLTWTLDDAGTLTISGTGSMTQYAQGGSPFYANTDIKRIIIEDGVTSIENYAFEKCENVESVAIPDSVHLILDGAFYCCYALRTFTIPDSVSFLGDSAFYGCYQLETIHIPDSVTIISNNTFYNCSSLTSVRLPDTVRRIGWHAFGNCKSLTSITLPDSLTDIGFAAFYGCKSLTSVSIPDSVTYISGMTFMDCASLATIKISSSVTVIENDAFDGCGSLTSVTLPDSVTEIDSDAFFLCKNLKAVTILNAECEIYDSASTISNCYDSEKRCSYFDGTIYGYTDSTAQAYAEKYGYKFIAIDKPSGVSGDINNDGVLSVSDAVLLQKWLLAAPGTHLINWKAADLCKDGKLNVFDLCMMKRALIGENETDTPEQEVTLYGQLNIVKDSAVYAEELGSRSYSNTYGYSGHDLTDVRWDLLTDDGIQGGDPSIASSILDPHVLIAAFSAGETRLTYSIGKTTVILNVYVTDPASP